MESTGYWFLKLLWELCWEFRAGAVVAFVCAVACGYLLGPWGGIFGLVGGACLGVLLEVRLRFGRWNPSDLEGASWYFVSVLSAGLFLMAVVIMWFALTEAR